MIKTNSVQGEVMVIVNPDLINHVLDNPLLVKIYNMVISDPEVNALWDMSNIMAVKRLKYNDHGPIHAKITAGSALTIFKILVEKSVEPSLIRDGVVDRVEYAYIIPLLGGLLHDIGNSIHRDLHEKLGSILAKPIIERVLEKVVEDPYTRYKIRQEVMHAIHCTAYDVECLSIEAGCVKVGDGTDMAEGRARIPYKLGGVNIHSVSALSIKKVEIISEIGSYVRINVYMSEHAGIFQVDEILMPKIMSTPLRNYVSVYAIVNDQVIKYYKPS